MRPIDYFYEKQTTENKACLLLLRELILTHNEDITESLRWNIPCYKFQDSMICLLNIDKKSALPYVLWVDGKALKHPSLVLGSRKRMRILHIDPNANVDVRVIKDLLDQAVSLKTTKQN